MIRRGESAADYRIGGVSIVDTVSIAAVMA